MQQEIKKQVATLNVNEINDEMARIKPLLDEGWEKILETYDEDEFEKQEFNYNYGFKCDPLIENTIRLDRRYNYLREQLKQEETKNKIICKMIYVRVLTTIAKEDVDDFVSRLEIELLGKVNKTDNENEPILYCRAIEPLKILCDELCIDVPFTCDVFLRDGLYVIEYDNDIQATCTRTDEVEDFMRKWVNERVDDVAKEAKSRFDNLLNTDCKTFLS